MSEGSFTQEQPVIHQTVIVKGSKGPGVTGIISIILGLISIFIFTVFFAPLAIITGIIGIFRSGMNRIISIVGIVFAFIGIITSPTIMFMLGMGAVLSSSYHASAPAPTYNPPAIKQATLPPPAPPVVKTPDPVKVVTGKAKTNMTSTLRVNDEIIILSGLSGYTGFYAKDLQTFIDSQGGDVTCTSLPGNGQVFDCKTKQGVDVGDAALLNGAAKATSDATDKQRQLAEQAKEARRGVWK